MGKRVLVLLNRRARMGNCALDSVLDHFRTAGLDVIEEPAQSAAAISNLIRGYADRVEAVILGGGDGTMNAAAAGLYETQLPFGLLPLGTANDLARTLDIPTDLSAAAAIITAGHTRRIDLGQCNDHYFFNAASLGMSVQITRKLSSGMKSRWGAFAYVIAATRVLFGSRPFKMEITHKGKTIRVKTSQIVIGNGRHFGGGLTVSADAQIDDGLLHLYSLELRRWWNVIPLLPALMRGTLAGSSHVRTMVGTEFEIRNVRRPRHVNTDGEITTKTPARFRVLPKALTVFAPPPR